jgi:hypothetical protein
LQGARSARPAIDIPLTHIPEGRQTVTLTATDQAGNRTTQHVGTINLDRTPPTVSKPTITRAGDRVTVTVHARDARSGLATIQGRTITDGNPGSWRAMTGGRLTLHPKKRVTVQTRATDRAGNAAQAPNVAIAPSTRRGKGGSRRPTRHRTPDAASRRIARYARAYAARSSHGSPVDCTVPVYRMRHEPVLAEPRRFKAHTWRAGFAIEMDRCIGRALTVLSRQARVEIVAASGPDRGKVVAPPREISFIKGVDGPVADVSFECNPNLDGVQSYRLIALNGYTGQGIDSSSRKYDITPAKIPDTITDSLSCPSMFQRQSWELDAWHALQYYNPITGRTRKPGDDAARAIFRSVLKDEKPKGSPSRAWEAHHIIPLNDMPNTAAARNLVAGAFRCHLYPNSKQNGVYLRSQDAKRGERLYDELPERDRARQYHGLTKNRFLPTYFNQLELAFSVAPLWSINGRGECYSHSRFFKSLMTVKELLTTGVFLPPKLESEAP